jgi:hypothetical protein
MQELQIKINQQQGVITTNFDEIKANLADQMKIYDELEVTEANKAERKKDIAVLRKYIKAVNEKRIAVKKECLKPYEEFEKKANELIDIINTPINTLDNQVKEFEEKQRLEKKAEIRNIYKELIGDLKENVPLSSIYDDKWENVSVGIKTVRTDMTGKIEAIQRDVAVIKGMVSDKTEDALEMYWNDLDLSKAIGFINRYEQQKKEIQARMEEQRKREQERELERERDRIRNEERARIRQEEQIKEEARLQAIKEQEAAKKAEIEAMAVQKLSNVTSMVFATFKVQATQEELGQIEMYMQSIGVDYERVD